MTHPYPPKAPLISLLLPFALLALAGCARDHIPNTFVEDTDENRAVIGFCEDYRQAVEKRDTGALLSMASRDYFDDLGTPAGDDDIDYEGLEQSLLKIHEGILGARYQISYRAVTVTEAQHVLVDMLYTGWFRVNTAKGPEWRRRLEPHRMLLAREGKRYKILSGM